MKEKAQLIARVREAAKTRCFSRKTENAYSNHIRRFLEFSGKNDLSRTTVAEVRAFLEHLKTKKHFSDSTQNQAVYALTFLFRDVFGRSLPLANEKMRRAASPVKARVVFTAEESKAVLANLRGAAYLAAALMYGAGLRLAEALNLRVGDLDFERGAITVRDILTGAKNRATVLPKSIIPAFRRHLIEVKYLHEDDCLRDGGTVFLPPAILRKFAGAESEWRWQYVFPSPRLASDGGKIRRRHLAESTVHKALNEAAEKARILRKGNCQTLRYSFAVRLFEKNTDVHTIQNLLGHKNLKTTMSYINFAEYRGRDVQSPLDY